VGHHLLLLPLLYVAVTTVRDDLRHHRITNARLLQGLLAGAAAYGLLLGLQWAGSDPALCSGPAPSGPLSWPVAAVVSLVVGLGVAIVLWLLGIWAAGDAKLFAVLAFLVPPAIYTRSFLPGFPGMPILVNVFALVFVYLIVDLLRTGAPAAWAALGDPERRAALLRAAPGAAVRTIPLLLAFIAMFAGIRAIREAAREGLAPWLEIGDFTLFLILFVAFRPLAALARNRWGALAFTVLSVAALVFLAIRRSPTELPGLVTPSVWAVALLAFARLYMGQGQTTRTVLVGELRTGQVLGKQSLQILRTREQKEVEEMGPDAPGPDEERPGSTAVPSRLGTMSVDGLHEEQIRYIRTRYDDDEPIEVERTVPFSPFLAAGAVLTYVLGGPLTELLRM